MLHGVKLLDEKSKEIEQVPCSGKHAYYPIGLFGV